ncbi:MAG: SDR family NAD(P)-dependent oxidoreductase [bacterium]|nr:SDR family NAD(P)-dependent oxidoreductase [Candidatus Minthenecus merdequi]
MNKYALVTGASSGIGLCYAKELASRGYNLFIISIQEKELAETAEMLKTDFGIQVHSLLKDLTAPDAADTLLDYVKEHSLDVEIVINNAGVFFFNNLIDTPWKRVELMLDLHIKTVTRMTQIFGAWMAERKHGYILNMSSMSAWMAMPGINIYNSTKAYILNFSRSMWYELKPYGVSVTAICPGAIDTGLYGLAPNLRRLAVNLQVSMPPEKLVKKALKAMFRKKKSVVPGWINGPFVFLCKHIPDWVVFLLIKHISKFMK